MTRNAELQSSEQNYGDDPLAARETDLYRGEFVTGFVEKWDELIDWDARAKSEGQFFIDLLRARGIESVLDVATGTGFHSVRLTQAFENGQRRGLILKTVQADWRELNRGIHGKYDAIICLGNSFPHLHHEQDHRKALAEFYPLNMFPLRKGHVRRLIREAGFERVRTYGDFQEINEENKPDFFTHFVHVAEKSVGPKSRLRQRSSRSSRRRHRRFENSGPIAVDAARLDPTRPRLTDERLLSDAR